MIRANGWTTTKLVWNPAAECARSRA
jgi:hypothetical protein